MAVFSFHKIGDPGPAVGPNRYYTPVGTFVDHLRFLGTHGWSVIDASAFLDGLENPENLPERTALLTFDDGYLSLRETALPWLRRFGFPAVTFVATDYIGRTSTFDHGIEPEERLCDWEDLRELERMGVSVQSHGVSHRRFSALCLAEQQEELFRSKELLESNLGNRVEVFAYPYGNHGRFPRDVAGMLKEAGYRAAFLCWGGSILLPFCDPYMLPRMEMRPDTELRNALARHLTTPTFTEAVPGL